MTMMIMKNLFVPDEDILSAPWPIVEQLWLREGEASSCSPSAVVSDHHHNDDDDDDDDQNDHNDDDHDDYCEDEES